jgi:RNA polymerase sigma-70 factor, ECF subfamily
MKKHADQKLVARLSKGDQQAFEAFFKSYALRLFRFARARLWNDDDLAEEAAQAAMSKAVLKLHTYRGEAALYTWLCTFCRHEISAILSREAKRAKQQPLAEDNSDIQAALESLAVSTLCDPIAEYKKVELVRLVQMAKNQLPALYSDVLEWKYFYGYSVKEIAEKISRSQKATESILTRSRSAFKEVFMSMARGGEGREMELEW